VSVEEKKAFDIAKKMFANNEPMEKTIKYTKISKKETDQLKAKIADGL